MNAVNDMARIEGTHFYDKLDILFQVHQTETLTEARDQILGEISALRAEMEVLEAKQQMILAVLVTRDDYRPF